MSESQEQVVLRMQLTAAINSNATEREAIAAKHGQVWDTEQLQEDFEVLGFSAPFVVVTRRSDGAMGSLTFQHQPRYYYDFRAKD